MVPPVSFILHVCMCSLCTCARAVPPFSGGDDGPAGGASLSARIDELQALLEEVQAKGQLTTSVRTGAPHFFDVIRDNEVLSVVVMPLLYLSVLLGWRLLPLALVMCSVGLVWGPGLVSAVAWMAPFLAALLVLAAAVVVVIAKAPFLERYRRRIYVYGVAVVVVCDYRILRLRVKGLDMEESDLAWERAHRRYARLGRQMYASLPPPPSPTIPSHNTPSPPPILTRSPTHGLPCTRPSPTPPLHPCASQERPIPVQRHAKTEGDVDQAGPVPVLTERPAA